MTPFNQLTPAEVERLALLSEELGEVQQVIGKILRHGYGGIHPGAETHMCNRGLLESELGDVIAATHLLFDKEDVDKVIVESAARDKLKKIGEWMHHQKE